MPRNAMELDVFDLFLLPFFLLMLQEILTPGDFELFLSCFCSLLLFTSVLLFPSWKDSRYSWWSRRNYSTVATIHPRNTILGVLGDTRAILQRNERKSIRETLKEKKIYPLFSRVYIYRFIASCTKDSTKVEEVRKPEEVGCGESFLLSFPFFDACSGPKQCPSAATRVDRAAANECHAKRRLRCSTITAVPFRAHHTTSAAKQLARPSSCRGVCGLWQQ